MEGYQSFYDGTPILPPRTPFDEFSDLARQKHWRLLMGRLPSQEPTEESLRAAWEALTEEERLRCGDEEDIAIDIARYHRQVAELEECKKLDNPLSYSRLMHAGRAYASAQNDAALIQLGLSTEPPDDSDENEDEEEDDDDDLEADASSEQDLEGENMENSESDGEEDETDDVDPQVPQSGVNVPGL